MKSAFPILSIALASLASADTPTRCARPSTDSGPCLTSFVWCTSRNQWCHSWAMGNPIASDSRTVALYRDQEYTLSWTGGWDGRGEDVEMRWYFYPLGHKDGEPSGSGLWRKNITDTNDGFEMKINFEEILSDFPTPYSNMTRAEASLAAASDTSGFIRITHPRWPGESLQTDMFIVLDGTARRVAETADELDTARRKKDLTIGLGVGLGVGIPIIVALVYLIARPPKFLSQRYIRTGKMGGDN